MRTVIDIDDDLLEAARPLLGTVTKKATVNAALAEVVLSRRRQRAVQRLVDGRLPDLANEKIMSAAWQ